jgi:hypothetical protein
MPSRFSKNSPGAIYTLWSREIPRLANCSHYIPTASKYSGPIAALFVALTPLTLAAEPAKPNTVQELHDMCVSSDLGLRGICSGYISGVADMMVGLPKLGLTGTPDLPVSALSICFDTVKYGAMTAAFDEWAEKHPELGNKLRLTGVIAALREKWPCPKP